MPSAKATSCAPLGYTLRPMAEKTNVPAATVAQYQEQLSEYREKLEWVRDYL
jgi:hypothetical protein